MDRKLETGLFVISLDFEIHWGVSEHRTVESYSENLRNVPLVIDKLLEIFGQYNIHATWATVGMLFCKTKEELVQYGTSKKLPNYENKKLSNYAKLDQVGQNISDDPYHYALNIIKRIAETVGQEVSTHTFSHYYCLEKGQTLDHFSHDIDCALEIAAQHNLSLESIVFPRNQYNQDQLNLLKTKGIKSYRGNELHWMYKPRSRADETKLRQLARLIDAYIKISGDNTHDLENNQPLNIPSSRFLRPYSNKLKVLDGIRLKRICNEMTYAAKNKKVYHLWWHPHNFGKNIDQNFTFLTKILNHYQSLHDTFNFQSMNMKEISQKPLNA